MNGIDIMKDILLTCKSFWVFYILKYKVTAFFLIPKY